MANEVQLSASIRSNLLLLQTTQTSLDRTQTRLSTGNKVNSALDGPNAFFSAKSLNQRASDLTNLKDGIGQAISTINGADTGITKIQDLVSNAQALTTSALSNLGTDSASVATRNSLATQYNAILRQIDSLAKDAGYAGKNLLIGSGLTLGVTQSSQASVNSITGISGATVTNVTKADTYTVAVSGDGTISGDAGDVATTEEDRGISNLQVNGFASTSQNTFSDITLKLSGGTGKSKTFTVTEGDESFTQTFTQDDWNTAKTNGTVLKFSHSFKSGTNVGFDVDFDSIENVPDTAGVGTSTIQKNINLQVSVTNAAGETITRDGLQSVGNGKVSDGQNAFSFDTGTARVTLDERQILRASSYTASASTGIGTGAAVIVGTPTIQTTSKVSVDETYNLTATAAGVSFNYATGNFDSYAVTLDGAGSAGTPTTVTIGATSASSVVFSVVAGLNSSSFTLNLNYNELKYITTASAASVNEVSTTIAIQPGATGVLSTHPFAVVSTSGFANNQVTALSVDVATSAGGSAVVRVTDDFGGVYSTHLTASAGAQNINATLTGGINSGAVLHLSFSDSGLSAAASTTTATSHAAYTIQVRGAYTAPRQALFNVRGSNTGSTGTLDTKQLVDASDQNNLTVVLNEKSTSIVQVVSQNVQTNGQGLQLDLAQNGWNDRSDIQNAIDQLSKATTTLRTASSNLGTNLNIIQTRQDFTSEFSNVLTEGASKLTQADQNEESANMLTLQTRQQLGTIALSLANQAQQAILRLF
ncbi:MAG TPA: flagellin [Candidatus Binatia bacterium]|nr:flagellin [Candidatus Binatia bacterium]